MPARIAAQPAERAFDVLAGWQQPLTGLRDDSVISARRRGAFSLGLSGYFRSTRSVLWRVNGDVTFTRLETRQNQSSLGGNIPRGSTDGHARPEYTLSVDAARRMRSSQFLGRAADFRLYTGLGVRRIDIRELLGSVDHVCIPEDLACSAGSDYRQRIGPLWRAGAFATILGAGVRTRLELGYQLSRPWHVWQHDLRFGLRYGSG